MKNKPERWIALSVVLSCVLLMGALGLILGKFKLPGQDRHLKVDFVSVAGLTANSPVKFAGAQVGRVSRIQVLRRRDEVTLDDKVYCVEVELELDPNLDLGDDVRISIKQDGMLGSRYVTLIPGRIEAAPLDYQRVLQGGNPVEIDDLLPAAQALLAGLQPTVQHLNSLTEKMDQQLPPLLTDLDGLLHSSSGLVGTLNNPQTKAQLVRTFANLAVISDNLKVVTTQAKGITSTLGERPWRLLWGGPPTRLPTEAEILNAEKPLPVPNTESVMAIKVKAP